MTKIIENYCLKCFSPEVKMAQQRKEDRIQIHRHQVLIILIILSRERIHGPIASWINTVPQTSALSKAFIFTHISHISYIQN